MLANPTTLIGGIIYTNPTIGSVPKQLWKPFKAYWTQLRNSTHLGLDLATESLVGLGTRTGGTNLEDVAAAVNCGTTGTLSSRPSHLCPGSGALVVGEGGSGQYHDVNDFLSPRGGFL